MTSAVDQEERAFSKHLRVESNAAIARAGQIATGLGLAGAVIPSLLLILGAGRDLELPIAFSLGSGLYALLVTLLARRNQVDGALLYVLLLPLVSLPTLFFLLAHAVMPAGAATYLTGPISYLYGFLIVLAGFPFRPRLAIAAGAISGAGYLLCYALGRPFLATIASADLTLTQDLTSGPLYAIKALMMFFTGLGVAGLSRIARRLVHRMLAEERQKSALHRLFGQYVSDEVRERIVAEKAGTLGERKKLVVLFADLRGFSTYSEDRAPEEIVVDLNAYFEAMVQAITAEGGVVDKFMGDAVMAVFGGVLELPDPAAASVRAARQMRRRLAELNASRARAGRAPFDNGIGLHYGEVLQGSIGSAERKEFTVIGDAVNTASRLEGKSKDFAEKILISAALHDALPAELRALCAPHGELTVKGKREPVTVYGVPDAA